MITVVGESRDEVLARLGQLRPRWIIIDRGYNSWDDKLSGLYRLAHNGPDENFSRLLNSKELLATVRLLVKGADSEVHQRLKREALETAENKAIWIKERRKKIAELEAEIEKLA